MFILPSKEDREYLLNLLVIDKDDITKTNLYQPKTTQDGVFLRGVKDGKTLRDHLENNEKDSSHVTREDLELLSNTAENGGLVRLDKDGYIDNKFIPPSIFALYYDFSTVNEMLSKVSFELPRDYGRLVMVKDAIYDSRSKGRHKWVLYRYIGPVPNDILSYQVIISEIDVDISATWENLGSELQSTVSEIDDMVKSSHQHNNSDLLNEFSEDENGNLVYKDITIPLRKTFRALVVGDSPSLLNGDIGLKVYNVREVDTEVERPSIMDDEMDYSQVIILSGDQSEKFKSDVSLLKSPKMNTTLMSKADSFYEGCINLYSVSWCDFKNVISANRFAYECQSLQWFPELDYTRLESAIGFLSFSGIVAFSNFKAPLLKDGTSFFSNCIKLHTVEDLYIPSIENMTDFFNNCISLRNLPDKLNIVTCKIGIRMFYKCTNIHSIGKINSPNLKNMEQMFEGCSNLISIEEINFTSCENTTDIFKDCGKLEHVGIRKKSLRISISFANTKLDYISLQDIITNLPNVSDKYIDITATPAALQITDEEIESARIKGWTIIK